MMEERTFTMLIVSPIVNDEVRFAFEPSADDTHRNGIVEVLDRSEIDGHLHERVERLALDNV